MRKIKDQGGMETWARGTEEGAVEVVRKQDVAPILDWNKEMANHPSRGYSPSKDMQRVASIPLVVVEAWLNEGVNIFDPGSEEEVRKRLNDPQWRHLRTGGGKL